MERIEDSMKDSKNNIDREYVDLYREKYDYVDQKVKRMRDQFLSQFGPNALKKVEGQELLELMFINPFNKDNMCRIIEFDKDFVTYFGSIWGGSSYKYGIYYRQEENSWVLGYHSKNKENVSVDRAVEHAIHIRSLLVQACEILDRIDENPFAVDYNKLATKINDLDPLHTDKIWFYKYLTIYGLNKLAPTYTVGNQKEVLAAFGEKATDSTIKNMGNFARIAKDFDVSPFELIRIYSDEFRHGNDQPSEADHNNENSSEIVSESSGDYYDDPAYTNSELADELKNNYNLIYFGAPGTGKSYELNKAAKKYFNGNTTRVTFHPDYTYSSFVGTYKPVPKEKGDVNFVTYEYVPGPFLKVLVKALKNPERAFLLIIEEINRANVAAVFGDIFQLLDREDGESEYPIEITEDMKKFLSNELGVSEEALSTIKIPNNMYIWATMNSADQGVFPIDTAFKRRWNFKYLGINNSEESMQNYKVYIGENDYRKLVSWNDLRKAINKQLLKFNINEDKLIGPFFIALKDLALDSEGNDQYLLDSENFKELFKNKVLMYLFEDAARARRQELFNDKINSKLYSEICNEFDKKGIYIFKDIENLKNAIIDQAEFDLDIIKTEM